MQASRLLEATNLSVSAFAGTGEKELIHDVSFSVNQSEVLVLLGESGSGKTVLSRALTNLFPVTSPMRIRGLVNFEGRSLLDLPAEELSAVRRRKIRYVFQEPISSLNPLTKIGLQLSLANGDPVKEERLLTDTLRLVGLDNAEEILELYPHQLSVGMAQRVNIAMAILPAPSLLIADEPTSAVDPSLKYALLDLLAAIRQTRGTSLILITHDLDVAQHYGDRIVVLYGGRVIESSGRERFFDNPLHPYSRLLIESHVSIGKPVADSGSAVSVLDVEIPGSGCRFHPRCPIVQSRCTEAEPELEHVPDNREVRCFYWK